MDVQAERHALVENLATEIAIALGGTTTPASAPPAAAAAGWSVSTTIGGSLQGRVTAWFDQAGLARAVTAALALDAAPSADAIGEFLTEAVTRATGALSGAGDTAPTFTPLAIAQGQVPVGGKAIDIVVDEQPVMTVVVTAEWPTPAADAAAATVTGPSSNDRLQAVLDVDLPLVVRFGGTVVPLRTLATLASGSMVDMNRAPDDPVDLLVGDRVIAKGEVVVVGGHYGVRILSLTNQAGSATGAAGV